MPEVTNDAKRRTDRHEGKPDTQNTLTPDATDVIKDVTGTLESVSPCHILYDSLS